MRRRLAVVLVVSTLVSLGGAARLSHAQDDDLGLFASEAADPAETATDDELAAYRLAQLGRWVKARETAEKILRGHPGSYVGHFVRGLSLHYGEASFARAVFEERIALANYERRWGRRPDKALAPWKWHERMLRELADTEGDLEHYDQRLAYLTRHDALYEPHIVAERAWALMKLGRYDAARRAARAGMATGDSWEREVALNALCAIEFEAGNDGASYVACRAALEDARSGGAVNAVDLGNFAEASRSMFDLDEAESVTLEATHAQIAWYGNPYMDLAELYTREARFPEALAALKKIGPYRALRPPHVRDADRAETRRAIAAFFLAVGRPDDALGITTEAILAPDRRAHNSRDPAQDRSLAGLLDRRAERLVAGSLLEEASWSPWWKRPLLWAQALNHVLVGWTSGREVAQQLDDDVRLVGIFRIGTAKSAVMPPWLAGDLVDVLGPGVVREAVARARRRDRRAKAPGYYDAFDAEAALAQGDEARARELAARALTELPVAEALLRARTHAIAAEAAWRSGARVEAARHYSAAFSVDPGVFRRLELRIPVRLGAAATDADHAVLDLLASSPRVVVADEAPFVITSQTTGRRSTACLRDTLGNELGCGSGELPDRVAASFHQTVFAPHVDLSQGDATTLDGSNTVGRDPLQDMGVDPSTIDGTP